MSPGAGREVGEVFPRVSCSGEVCTLLAKESTVFGAALGRVEAASGQGMLGGEALHGGLIGEEERWGS